MKTLKLLLIVVLLITTGVAKSQDVIVKKDNSTILSKVTRISETEIEYKKWSNLDGPIYTIDIVEIVSINYQNGEVEYFSTKPENPITTQNQVLSDQAITATNQKPSVMIQGHMKRHFTYLTLNGRKLADYEVNDLVGEENFATYWEARGQIQAGYAGAATTIIAAVVGIILVSSDADPVYSISLLGAANITLIYTIVCLASGTGRMNWVARDFNEKHDHGYSYNLSPSIIKYNGPQLQNNYGLGLTFSVNF